MTARIHRGFHRIGVVLAVPPLLTAGWRAGGEAWQAWTTPGLPQERMLNGDGSVTLMESFNMHHAHYGYALTWAAVGVALYVAARAVGWVIAGFIGSDSRPSR